MIQYYHKRTHTMSPPYFQSKLFPRGGETIALETPQYWLVEQLVKGDTIIKSLGKARCSDEDNYNKKLGRELATSRMKPTKLTVVSNTVYGVTRFVELADPEGNVYTVKKNTEQSCCSKCTWFVDYE